jgi:hypothetical protein
MNKKGKFPFSVKWLGSSVSGLVAIIGAFIIWLSLEYNRPDLTGVGIGFVLAGLVGAILMTVIIKTVK